jgi:hypothetical protein
MRHGTRPPLSFEGSREVKEEMARPPENTPERRRLFDLARVRMDVRVRHEADLPSGKPE